MGKRRKKEGKVRFFLSLLPFLSASSNRKCEGKLYDEKGKEVMEEVSKFGKTEKKKQEN